MNPHTGRDFVQFGKTESGLNKGAEEIAPLFNPPPVLSLEIMWIKLAQAFGKGAAYGIGILFLPVVFLPMLGFGDAQFVGPVVK